MELPSKNGRTNLCETTFQIAEVTRPLMSVSKLGMRGGYDVLCRKDKAYILDEDHKVVALFEQRNGLYVGNLNVTNPKHSGFMGQDR